MGEGPPAYGETSGQARVAGRIMGHHGQTDVSVNSVPWRDGWHQPPPVSLKGVTEIETSEEPQAAEATEEPPRDMSRWLGDGGMAILSALGVDFDDYGIEDDDAAGWATAVWVPTPLACNPHGSVQAGVHSVVLDAAMNFAANAGLRGKDRTKATVEMKTELMRPASEGDRLAVRGAVMRETQRIAFAEARIEDADGRLVSRATGTFLVHRA